MTPVPKFEVFTRRMVPLVKSPYVTIQKRGTISLNASAHGALGAPEAVELLFDRTARIVGLRAVDQSAPHAYPLRNASSKEGVGPWVISASAFVKYYDIDTTVSRRWAGEVVDGVLCLDLTTDGAVVTSNRSRNSSTADAMDVADPDPTD